MHDDGTSTNDDRLGALGDVAFAIEHGDLGGDDLLVIAADNLFEFSVQDYVDFWRAKGRASAIAVHRLADPSLASLYGVVELDEEDRVVGLEEKPSAPRSDLVSTAAYLFAREHVELLERYLGDGLPPDPPGRFLVWLHEREPVYGYRFAEDWLDIGDPAQLLEADNRYRARAGLPPATSTRSTSGRDNGGAHLTQLDTDMTRVPAYVDRVARRPPVPPACAGCAAPEAAALRAPSAALVAGVCASCRRDLTGSSRRSASGAEPRPRGLSRAAPSAPVAASRSPPRGRRSPTAASPASWCGLETARPPPVRSLAAELVSEVVPAPAADVITYIPPDGDRSLKRGHEPAAELARALATRWNLEARRCSSGARPSRARPACAASSDAGTSAAHSRRPALAERASLGGARRRRLHDRRDRGAAASALRTAGVREVHVVTFARAIR